MKTRTRVWIVFCLAVCAAVTAYPQATIYKADNATALNDAASWDGGTAPTAADIAAWDSRVGAGSVTVDIGGAVAWDGLLFTDPADNVTINGVDKLTLDGGAAIDIDMSAAARDLTINTTVALDGSCAAAINAGRTLTLNGTTWASGLTRSGDGRLVFAGSTSFGNSVFNAGDTVWAATATASGSTKLSGGDLTLKGATLITSGGAEALAVYNGTLVLDGGALSMTNAASRVFAGRTDAASDGLMIVSNGTHRIEGVNNGSMANFVGVSGAKRGRLLMEGGSLAVKYLRLAINHKGGQVAGSPDEIVVNGGTLTAEGTSVGFMMCTYFDESMIGNSDRDGRLTLNGGRFEIPNGLTRIAPDAVGGTHAGSAEVLLNGGVWSVKQLVFGNDLNVARSLTFDGGTLEGTNVTGGAELILNAPAVSVRAGGAFLAASAGTDCRVTANFEEAPASPGGALVKTGPGRLTLGGTHTLSAPLIVSNGLLCLTGTVMAQTNLVVAPGAGLSLADGALSALTPTSLRIGTALGASLLELEVAASGSACDALALPDGAWFQQVAVSLVLQGTRTPVARTGDFPIMTYAGTVPSAGNLSWGNPVLGLTCTFSVDAGTRTVYAHVAPDAAAGESIWIHDGSGAWADTNNWNVAPGNAPGTRVLLGALPSAPSTVTLDAAATVGEMTFSNANAYALSGSGSLTLNNGASAPSLSVAQGSQTVALPLSFANNLTLSASSGSALTLGGAISGAAALVKQGSGDVVLTADNSYAGGTTIQGGILALEAGASVGAGPVNIAADAARFRAAGTDPVTVTNTVVVAASGGMVDALVPMTLTGTLDWLSGSYELHKAGVSVLIFKGTAVETGTCRIRHRNATIRVADGARLELNSAVRDTIYMADGTSSPRMFTVETGAVVVAGGLYTGSGPSNTVWVNGGSLTLLGSGSFGENGLIRTVTDVDGTDRIIVDAGTLTFSVDDWLSLGVRGGSAEIIVNGGTATFGRLSLGVRSDVFTSTGVYTDGQVWVNGGVMDVAGAFNWMSDTRAGRVNQVYLNGGTLRLPATIRSTDVAIANSSEFKLNGGTLQVGGLGNLGGTSLDNYLSGLNSLYVDQGGAVIDTHGYDVTVTQALQRVGSTAGGLTKRGAGTLTLTGACGVVGMTAVEEGTLRLQAATATAGLSVSNGATLSLRSGAYETLTLSAATLASGARVDFDVASDSASCDQIGLPSGASLGAVAIGLFVSGGDAFVTRPDAYPVFGYAGTPPDVSGLTLAPEAFGVACTFVTNEANQTIDAVIAYNAAQSEWQNSGSGNWSVSGNWWPQAPAAEGAVTRFGGALAADSTVTVDGAVSVAGMIFDHTYRYTLDGSAVTLSNGVGAATVEVKRGAHKLASPLLVTGSTVASVAADAELNVSGPADGAGSLAVQGGGLLTLDGTNTTPLTVSGGSTVAVPDVDSLGGAALTLDGGALKVAASDTLGGNVTLASGGGTFRSATGETLLLDATVTGAGGLTKAGAGTVTLGASAGGYDGATESAGGTLSLGTVPAGELVLGAGTLAFTGTSGSSSQPVTLASGTNAAVLRADGDVTLSGPFVSASGAFFKRGAGALTLAGANTNLLGLANAANLNAVAATGADGDGPAAGYGAFNVAEGRVTLGAAGQTNAISGALLVGLNTTAAADAETAGELVVAGGVTTCGDWTYVGRNNGSTVTAPAGLASRLLVQEGDFETLHLSLGGVSGLSGYTGRPELEIQEGAVCTVDDILYVSDGAGGISTLWVNGGTLRHRVLYSNTSARLGNSGGEGVLRITSGSAEFAKDLILAATAGATGTVELAGGTLQAQNVYKLNASGYARVLFDGGVYRPTGGALSGLDAAQIGDGPAIIDTSLSGAAVYNLAQVLTGAGATDGGFVKAGTNALNVNAAMAYSGPTVVSAGVLRVTGSLPAASALTVAPGARLALNNASVKTVTAGGLTLGDASDSTPAELEFGVVAASATNDQIVVNGDVTAYHAAFALFWQSSQTDNIVGNGRYELLRWTGSGPSSTEAFSVANPQPGKQYVFSVAGQSLWLDVGAATSGVNYVWSSTGGGNWSDGGKWVAAPGAGAAGVPVRFDGSVTAASTVLVDQSATVGSLYFNSTNSYTLAKDASSALTLDNSGQPAVAQIEQGRHIVKAPVVLQSQLDVKPISGTELTLDGAVSGDGGIVKLNGGDLMLGGANSFTGGLRLVAGSVTLTNGAAAGSGPVGFESDAVPLRVRGAAATSVAAGGLAVRTAQAKVDVGPTATLRSEGSLAYETASAATLVKQGGGDLVMAGDAAAASDNARVSVEEGALRFASGADYRIGDVGRDVFRMDANSSVSRTLAVESGAQVAISGLYLAYGTNTVVVDGQLELTGNDDAVCLRVSTSDPTVVDRFTVGAAGSVTAPQAAWFNVGIRGPGELLVAGGSAQLGSVSLGYKQQRADQYGGAYGRVFVTDGGLLDVTGVWNWMGDSNGVKRSNMLLVGDGGAAGATARLPPTTRTQTAGWSSLGLDKGTLVTTGGGLTPPVAGDYLYGLKQLYVSTNGGTFDTAGQAVTLSQKICSDGAGGSLAKAGAGSLTLSQPLAWGGLVDVQAGALSASLTAAAFRGREPTNLLARYSFENGRVADTSGNGRHGASWGSAAITSVTDPLGCTGVNFPSGTVVTVSTDAEIRGMDAYTVAMWVKVATVTGGGTFSTFFTTRMGNGTDPYQIMVRIYNEKLYFMASSPSGNWPGDYRFSSTLSVPAGQWFHAAAAVTASGLKLYVNGLPAGSWSKNGIKFCPPTRPIGSLGFGFGYPYLTTSPSGEFTGQLDDVQIYGRALSDAEVASLAAAPAAAGLDLRVAGGSVLEAQSPVAVRDLSGEGSVAGEVTVYGRVAPGDSTNAPAGAVLMAEALTFATNSVYAWSWAPEVNDQLMVGTLTINGAGVVDLGRQEGQPINGSFRAVLMRYDTLVGGANLAGWTLSNVGGMGYNAVIKAENNEVVLEYESTRGTLLLLK